MTYDSEIFEFDNVPDALRYCDFTSRFSTTPEMRALFKSLGCVIRSLAEKVERLTLKGEQAEARRDSVTFTNEELVALVEQWAKDRRIIPNSTPMAQLLKTMSELGELADATIKGDMEGATDGVGDTLVTLIIYCALQGLDINGCLASAYDTIKDRKGTLTPEGVFVKSE